MMPVAGRLADGGVRCARALSVYVCLQVDWGKIKPPPDGMVKMHSELAEPTADQLGNVASKLAVLKLNGASHSIP